MTSRRSPSRTQTGGLTNYEDALDLATDFFDAVDPAGTEDNFVLLRLGRCAEADGSDGNPATTFLDEAAELQASGMQ